MIHPMQKNIDLAKRLDDDRVFAVVSKSVVTLYRYTDSEFNESESVDPTKYGITSLYMDDHPEGADRGGYVMYVETADGTRVFYRHEDEWSW